MRWIQKLHAVMISHLYESSLLRDFLEFLWPRFKTLRLANRLRKNNSLNTSNFHGLSRVRRYRHWYGNIVILLPMFFCAFVFLLGIYYTPYDIGIYTGITVTLTVSYLNLRDDYADEWQYVYLLTEGIREKGLIVSLKKSVIGNAVTAEVLFQKSQDINIISNMFLWHGVAPNFPYKVGDDVIIAYIPQSPLSCAVITDETERFNLRKEKP